MKRAYLALILGFYLIALSQQNSIQCLSQLEDAQDTLFSLRENILAGNILESITSLAQLARVTKGIFKICEGHFDRVPKEQGRHIEIGNCQQGLAYISLIIDDILMDVDISEVIVKVMRFGSQFQQKCLPFMNKETDGPNIFLNGLRTIEELTNLLDSLQDDKKVEQATEEWVEDEEKVSKEKILTI